MWKDSANRRCQLREVLSQSTEPLTGQDLAEQFGVTRQVVVHDIALLRAEGIAVISTPRGYLVATADGTAKHTSVIAVAHPPHLAAVELYTLVDFGVRVVDVQVEHPVYGELKGSLHLASRRDVELFLQQVQETRAPLLSSLTDGQHMHAVEAPDNRRLQEAIAGLRQCGIQVFD